MELIGCFHLSALLSLVAGFDYCGITPQHTMCQYKGTGPACRQLFHRGVSDTDKTEILDEHNKLRAFVANGQEKRQGGQPSASNMMQLHWDDELATLAQRHADQCVFRHDCNECRAVARFHVGQNLYTTMTSWKTVKYEWRHGIRSFYDEVAMFSPRGVPSYRGGGGTGHYTQVVWASTRLIGCGATKYVEDGMYTTLYTCTYGPSGNVLSFPIYSTGVPCSQCPANTECSSKYSGLCTSPSDNDSGGGDKDRGGGNKGGGGAGSKGGQGNSGGESKGGDKNSGGSKGGDKNSGGSKGGDKNSGGSKGGDGNIGGSKGGDKNSGGSKGGDKNSGGSKGGDRNSGGSKGGNGKEDGDPSKRGSGEQNGKKDSGSDGSNKGANSGGKDSTGEDNTYDVNSNGCSCCGDASSSEATPQPTTLGVLSTAILLLILYC